jgi:pilus assembly protein CpaE
MTEIVVTTTTPVRERLGVAVIDEDDAVRSVLIDHVRRFDSSATTFENVAEFQDSTDPLKPAVVVIGPSADPDEAIRQAERMLFMRQNYGVVMVVYDLSTRLLQQALRAGVVDVVAVAAEDEELLEALSRAASRVEKQTPRPAAPSGTEPGPAPEGRVVTVFCTKGGAGKSVTAVNLAVTLARRTIQPVVLVDADLQFGDIALMLQLQPSHTIMDAVQAGERVDRNLVESILLRHEPSGVLVLAAPTEPTSADQITRDDLVRVLSVLREMCAYIVIDTSPNFGEVTLAALESSNDILVLAGLDVMSLKSARVGLQTMRILGIPFSKVKFVLNRANTRVGLTEADAEHALQLKVDVALPSELDVAASVNRGTPVVLSSPKSKFTRSIENLATLLTSQRAAT